MFDVTLVYDTLESTNTSTVNQVVNQLKITNFYSPENASVETVVPGYFDIAVLATVKQDISSNTINGINFQDDTKLVMDPGTTTDIKGAMSIWSDANVVFEAGSIVSFENSNTTFNDVTLNGRIITTSDRKLKTNIQPLTDTLEQVKHIHGHRYQRIDQDTERMQIGLIAQEVEKTYPELVSEEGGIKRVDYISFIAVLLGCIQELETRIVLLENKASSH